jgi:Fic family protein
VRKSPKGLRAEQIRKALGMEAREMPRVLKEGLAKKTLKSKGEKRSTMYSAAA